jgi:hypothetical protein
MNRLTDHLARLDPLDYFAPSEMNHIVLFVYGILRAATREECDTIAFTKNDVTWSKDGLPIRQQWESPHRTITFRETMRQIVARDPVVREWVRPAKRDSPIDMDVYQFVAPALAAVATGDEVARTAATVRS